MSITYYTIINQEFYEVHIEQTDNEITNLLLKKLQYHLTRTPTEFSHTTKLDDDIIFSLEITTPNPYLTSFIKEVIKNQSRILPYDAQNYSKSTSNNIKSLICYSVDDDNPNIHYIAIQHHKNIFKSLSSQKDTKFFILNKDSKFKEAKEKIHILNIKNFFDAVIKVEDKNNSTGLINISFYQPLSLTLCDIPKEFPATDISKFNTKDSYIAEISSISIFNKHIHHNSFANIVLDKTTIRKLTDFLNFTEERLTTAIQMLSQKEHKDTNYVINNQIFFPKDKKIFKEFLKIIFNKELEIDFLKKYEEINKTPPTSETD